MGVIPSWVCRFFYTRRSVVSYVDNFRLGSADFFYVGVIPSWVCRFFYTRKSVVSYVDDFRLGSADFSYGGGVILGITIFS